MAEDFIRVDETGVSGKSLADNRADTDTDMQGALGDNISLRPQTPQGQFSGLIAVEKTLIGERVTAVGNATSIDNAQGTQLDRLTGQLLVERPQATRSRVTATVRGVNGTNLPQGSRARTDPDGARFRTVADTVLTSTGTSVEMESVDTGPVVALAGTLTDIETAVPGWEGVTNAADATLGTDAPTDPEYRRSYRLRVAENSNGYLSSLAAGLETVGAGKVKIVENRTHTSIVRQQWTIYPHHNLVIAETGTDADLTRAIENHRGMGSGTMAAVRGGTPNDTALQAVTNGTVEWDGVSYTGLDLSGTTDQDGKAAALNALTQGTPPVGIPVTAHYQWSTSGYYVAVYAWMPDDDPMFGDGTVETAFGFDPASASQSPGPFVRPGARPLTVAAVLTRVAERYPADGLNRLRENINAVVAEYEIGQTVYVDDFRYAVLDVPGVRVTSLTVQEAGNNVDTVVPPLDVLWTLDPSDLSITIT